MSAFLPPPMQSTVGPWHGIDTRASAAGAPQPDKADKPIAPYVMAFNLANNYHDEQDQTYRLPRETERHPEYLGTQVGDVLLTHPSWQDKHPRAKLRGITCLNGWDLDKIGHQLTIAGYPIFKELADHESGAELTVLNYTKAGRLSFYNATTEIWPDNTRLIWDFPDKSVPRSGTRVTMVLVPLVHRLQDWFSFESLCDPKKMISNRRIRQMVQTYGLDKLAKSIWVDGDARQDNLRVFESLKTSLMTRVIAEGTVETVEAIYPGTFGRCVICRGA